MGRRPLASMEKPHSSTIHFQSSLAFSRSKNTISCSEGAGKRSPPLSSSSSPCGFLSLAFSARRSKSCSIASLLKGLVKGSADSRRLPISHFLSRRNTSRLEKLGQAGREFQLFETGVLSVP